jgi:hypothetical protein
VVEDELEELLADRLGLSRADLITALRLLPAHRPGAAALTVDQARLLDSAGLEEDPQAYAELAADSIGQTAVLINSGYTAAEVADGLGVNESRVRQRRLARTLWAVDDGGRWVYPAVQFEKRARGRPKLKLVRGLEQVLPALPPDLHPSALAAFLLEPRPELVIRGRANSVREWLLSGGSAEPVLALADVEEWAGS